MDELVLTMLSANTSDVNSGRAFERLQATYGGDWQAVLDAPLDELTEVIRPAGLGPTKAPRIQAALRRILDERGAFDISFLADLPVDEGLAWLTSLDGVGHKTASIVLLFCFNKPAFPVDTHVQTRSASGSVWRDRRTTRPRSRRCGNCSRRATGSTPCTST